MRRAPWLLLVLLVCVAAAAPWLDAEVPRRVDGRVFFVCTSAESEGNRLCSELIIAGGCSGAAVHGQPFDYSPRQFDDWPSRVRWDPALTATFEAARCFVLHRSLPHAHRWPNMRMLVGQLVDYGFRVHVVVPLRMPLTTAASQLQHGHVNSTALARQQIERAHRIVGDLLGRLPRAAGYTFMLTAELHRHPEYVRDLLLGWNLTVPRQQFLPRFYDPDAKYFLR
jgi:hypothetical protein